MLALASYGRDNQAIRIRRNRDGGGLISFFVADALSYGLTKE